ncbi:MAG: hypothetical protein ACTSYT_03050, partial [Candidatus Asgardarchaeia archaeon]
TPIVHQNLTIRVVWSDGVAEEHTLETDQDGKCHLEISPRSGGDVEFYIGFDGTEYYEPASYSFTLNIPHGKGDYTLMLLVLSSSSLIILTVLLAFKYKKIGVNYPPFRKGSCKQQKDKISTIEGSY